MTDPLLRHSPGMRAAAGAALLVSALLVVTASLANILAAKPDPSSEPSLLVVLVHGARSLVAVGFISTSIALVGGVVLGAMAGFAGGAPDRALTRLVELLAAFPTIVMVAVITAFTVEPSALVMGGAIAAVRLSEVARLVRIEIIRWHGSDLALAARSIGASAPRILVVHLGPQLAGVLAQSAVSTLSAVVVIQTLVEFVGLGGRTGSTSWGAELARAIASGHNGAAVVLLGAVAATVASTQILAEYVRESFDPYAGRATPCAPRG